MRRRRIITAVVVLALLVGGGTWLLLRGDAKRPGRTGIDPAAARVRAVKACAAVDELFALVIADGPAPDVLDAADKARMESAAARELDPMWSGLASGADALVTGLRQDDGRTTGLGRQVVDAQCAFLRAPEPAATASPQP